MKKNAEQSGTCGTSSVDASVQSDAASLPASDATLEPESGIPTAELIKSLIEMYPNRKKAADVAGVSTDQIYKYLAGKNEPSFTTVRRLADGLGISLDDLVQGTAPYRFVDSSGGAILGAVEPSPDEFVRLLSAARDVLSGAIIVRF